MEDLCSLDQGDALAPLGPNVLLGHLHELSLKRHHNSKTTFLSLPQEIKDQIYKLVLGGHVIHMKGFWSYIDHSILSREYESSPPGSFYFVGNEHTLCRSHHDTRIRISVALFYVCTQVYNEVHSIFWSCNTFVFSILDRGIYLQDFIRVNNLKAIRMLDLELIVGGITGMKPPLEDTIQMMVSSMNNLKKVRIAICEASRRRNNITMVGSVMDILKPLAKLSLKESTVVMRHKRLERFAQARWKSMQDSLDKENEEGDAATSQSQ